MIETLVGRLPAVRLAFFDVDGTLKAERDPYLYLHRRLGTEAEGLAALEAFTAGRIDYDAFAQRDAALWAGAPIRRIDALFRAVPYIAAARALAEALQDAGAALVLVSTGLDRHVRQVAGDLGAAAWACNELRIAGGRVAGSIGVNVPWDGKGRVVRSIMARYAARPEECLAAGDGASDLAMFAEVGHRVAVNPATEAVAAAADWVLGS